MTTSRQCIKVEHLRQKGYRDLLHWLETPTHVYIGRNCSFYVEGASASKWRNTFTVKKFGRAECLRRYREHLVSSGLMEHIEELRGCVLGCFCAPGEDCHGDILCEILNK